MSMHVYSYSHYLCLEVDRRSSLQQSLNSLGVSLLSSYPKWNMTSLCVITTFYNNTCTVELTYTSIEVRNAHTVILEISARKKKCELT